MAGGRREKSMIKAQKAYELKVMGHTWDEIAQEVGYVSRQNAHRAVENFIGKLPEVDREEARRIARDRGQFLYRIASKRAQEGKSGAVQEAARVLEILAKLDGLNAPTELNATLYHQPAEDEFMQVVRHMAAAAMGVDQRDALPIEGDPWADRFTRLAKRAGLPVIRLHDLRHSALSLMLEQGVPAPVVARIGGHDVATLLRTYAHAQDDATRRAVEALGALYG